MNTTACAACGQPVHTGDWPFCPHGPAIERFSSIHPSERAIKYYHPKYGYRAPGRNDEAMPERYRQAGFERVEFNTLQALEQHAKETGSRSAILDYNPGSDNERKRYGKVSEVQDG